MLKRQNDSGLAARKSSTSLIYLNCCLILIVIWLLIVMDLSQEEAEEMEQRVPLRNSREKFGPPGCRGATAEDALEGGVGWET